jgi:hypothetical protein
MKKTILCVCLSLLIGIGLLGSSAVAATIALFDWAFNADGTVFTPPGPLPGAFDTSGFDFASGLGTVKWTGGAVGANSFIAFFDHEIDEAVNTFFNEFGATAGTPAAGQSWEIDEPGFVFGNIYSNVSSGFLDNSNAVPAGSEDDVSMALGWDFDLSNPLDVAVITMVFNDSPPAFGFYLIHTDPDSGANVYFSSSLEIRPIPLPGAMLLLGSGLASLWFYNRKKSQ